jgi:excisionase family DNA binding protein
MSPDEQQDQVYTIAEVARLLKVSEQVVRQLVLSGELRSKKVGRQYRITREMLQEYLDKPDTK